MIKTREELLAEIERGTLARVRDLLRRGAALFEGTLEQLHAELVTYESDAAQALVDFDKLTEDYNVERLPVAGS
jgi:hypothetical protein